MSNIVKKVFAIDGMHCSSCAMNIDFDLEDLDGVTESKTSFARQKSEITYDVMKVSEEDIIKTVKQTGYTAHVSEKSS